MEQTATTPRYQPTYRQAELRLIVDNAKQGQSLCFVGIAGTGKSNITNFLHSDPYGYKPHHFGEQSNHFRFPVVDGNIWNQTPTGLWQIMQAALGEVSGDLVLPEPDGKLIQLSEEQKVFSELKSHVDWLCQKREQQVIFMLDDFDQVLTLGPLAMLEQLNALRSGGNRGKLSYLLFTKQLPHVLGRNHPLKGRSKFYDLFGGHIYALTLYNHEDARQMLVHLNERAGKPLPTRDLALIESLAGGHARLLRVIFDLWRQEAPTTADFVAFFVGKSDVREECQRILRSLHPAEQATAQRVAHAQHSAADEDIIEHLLRRGLLSNSGKLAWFSPLFGAFLRTDSV